MHSKATVGEHGQFYDPPGCVVACVWVGLHRQALLYDIQRLLPVLLRMFH